MPSRLREQIDEYLADAHEYTALGRATLENRGGRTVYGLDPDTQADTMSFLIDMVRALEESIRILATAIDASAPRQ